MRAKFGRNPTVGSKKVPFKFISRCLHDMMGNISVDISGFHLTNQIVQQWQKPTFIRTAERMLHITHHIMHIHI